MTNLRRIVLAAAFALAPVGAARAQAQTGSETAAPRAATQRVQLVGVMLQSGQVLLWDAAAGEYILRRVGDELEGGRIADLDADRLYLERNGATEEIALVAAPRAKVAPRSAGPAPAAATVIVSDAAPRSPVTVSPSQSTTEVIVTPPAPRPAAAATAPLNTPLNLDPGMEPLPPTPAAAAPLAPLAPPAAVAPAPPPAEYRAPIERPSQTRIEDPYSAMSAPAAPSIAAQSASPVISLRRADFDARLGNFELLGDDVNISPIPGGGYQILAIRPGSYVERLGLRAGDVIVSIDGRQILSPDDAARAYAWLRLTDHFTVDVYRNRQHLMLQYQIVT